jgi:hypothetical protein
MAELSERAGGGFPSRLHWGSIIAGALVALASHVVLGLVGAALGLAAEPADSRGVGAGAAIWGLLTPFVATLIGAWVAVRSADERSAASSNLHGVLVWCIGLLAGAIFLTGTLATGAMSAGAAASNPRAGRDRGAVTERQQDRGAGRTAAGVGGGALASLLGLAGAFAGAAIARRPGRFRLGRRREARFGGDTYATAEGADRPVVREGSVPPPPEVVRREGPGAPGMH